MWRGQLYTFTYVHVDSNRSVLEHLKTFHSQKKEGTRNQTQGSHWESNTGRPALAAGTLTTELQSPPATQATSLQLLRVIDKPIPKVMLRESTGTTKSPSIEHQYQ